MLYIENNSTDPTYNLAFEEYLFRDETINEPILLLWQNGPSVIIGKYQNALEEVDMDYLREHDVKLVRRSTGGGAVYHDLGNLNFSFIVPRDTDLSELFEVGTASSVDTSDTSSTSGNTDTNPQGPTVPRNDSAGVAEVFSIPVIKALASLGIKAERSGRNDLLANGCKFSGCAEQRSAGRILHHGTLMFDVEMDAVTKALRVKPGKFKSKAVKSVRSRVTNLKPLLIEAGHSEDMSVLDLKALLLEHFRDEYNVRDMELREDQLAAIGRLQAEKYGNDAWNLGRSPKADIIRSDFFPCGQIEFRFSVDGANISDVAISGDFFSTADSSEKDPVRELERSLTGLPYERSAILKVLEQTDLVSLFGNITAGELIEVLV